MLLTSYVALCTLPEVRQKTPFAQQASHEIHSVAARETSVAQFEIWDAKVDLGATFDNPFDAEDVSLRAQITTPSGKTHSVGGYFEEPFQSELVDKTEVMHPDGGVGWRLRYAPQETGTYRVSVTVTDRNGTSNARSLAFESTPGPSSGFIHISPRDRRFFEFSNGKSYFPIGSNVAWGNEGGSYDIERWFTALSDAGANYARIWLSPANRTFALETVGAASVGKGLGTIELGNAWRLDRALALAQQKGIHVIVTIDSSQVLSYSEPDGFWGRSPHNLENGGPLRIWSDFWTAPRVETIYQNKLRYLMARYGAYRSVFAWEFWADVDQVHDFNVEQVRDWHQRMVKFVRDQDPYGHLLTTSTSVASGIRDLDLMPELDFAQTHYYGPDPAQMIAIQQSRKANWGKPHFVSEIGADDSSSRSGEDRIGLQVHDPLWASVATGVAGGAAPWYWDSLLETNSLFPLFRPLSTFVQDIDFPAEAFQQVHPSLAYAEAKTRAKRAIFVPQVPAVWGDAASNRPRTLNLNQGSLSGPAVSVLQHGLRNHRNWANPVLFKLNLPEATRFEVEVGDVSGLGGAVLRMELDGDRILTRNFADPDDLKTEQTIRQYRGVYAITVPAGYHTVKVMNIGNDWFAANYRIVKAGPLTTRPPLDSFGVVGNSVAIAWLRVEGRTWQRTVALNRTLPAVGPSVMRLNGLASGTWLATIWNTWKGTVIKSFPVAVRLDGIARISVPSVEKDVAIKLVRSSSQKGK